MNLFTDKTILSPSTAHRLPRPKGLKLTNWLLAKHKINASAFFIDDDLLDDLLKAGFHNDRARAFADLWRQLPDSVRAHLQPRPKPATPPPPPAPDQHSEDENDDDKKENDSSLPGTPYKLGFLSLASLSQNSNTNEAKKGGFLSAFNTDLCCLCFLRPGVSPSLLPV